jgi:hypothetical protein
MYNFRTNVSYFVTVASFCSVVFLKLSMWITIWAWVRKVFAFVSNL